MVAITTIAQVYLATGVQPERSIIFAAWLAQKKGLNGFCFLFITNFARVLFYINSDMIRGNSKTDKDGALCGITHTAQRKKVEN